jgi:hypothetical protein
MLRSLLFVVPGLLLLLAPRDVSGFSTLSTLSDPIARQRIPTFLKQSATSHNQEDLANARRNFLIGIGLLSSQLGFQSECSIAQAEDTPDDLTTQLFNPDGFPKGEIEEAKTRPVQLSLGDEPREKYAINVDGKNQAGTQPGSKVRLSYQVPEKWEQKADGRYIDISTPD